MKNSNKKNNSLLLKIDFKVSAFKTINLNLKNLSKGEIEKIVENIDYDDYDDFIDAKIINYQIEPKDMKEKEKWHADIFWGRI